VFPSRPDDRKPLTKHGFNDATDDPHRIETWWWRNWRQALICAPTGAPNDLLVIDIDLKNGKNGLAEWEELRAGRTLPLTRTATTPSGGKHLYFQYRDGVRIGHLSPGVEFKGDGGSITLPPSRRPDGDYTWDNDLPIAEPPDWLVNLCLSKKPKAPCARSEEDEQPSPELVALMQLDAGVGLSTDPDDYTKPIDLDLILKVISPDCPREEWFQIGCVIFKLFGDEKGFEVWDTWSAGSDKYKPREMAEQWASIVRAGGYGWNVGTLIFLANKADPNWRMAKIEAELNATNTALFNLIAPNRREKE
jgi:hypothetical protein